MKFVADEFWFGINNDVHVARAQPAAKAKKAERETRRQLKPVDQDMTTVFQIIARRAVPLRRGAECK